MATTFDNLTPENKAKIFGYLNRMDVLSSRLVSKTFCTATFFVDLWIPFRGAPISAVTGIHTRNPPPPPGFFIKQVFDVPEPKPAMLYVLDLLMGKRIGRPNGDFLEDHEIDTLRDLDPMLFQKISSVILWGHRDAETSRREELTLLTGDESPATNIQAFFYINVEPDPEQESLEVIQSIVHKNEATLTRLLFVDGTSPALADPEAGEVPGQVMEMDFNTIKDCVDLDELEVVGFSLKNTNFLPRQISTLGVGLNQPKILPRQMQCFSEPCRLLRYVLMEVEEKENEAFGAAVLKRFVNELPLLEALLLAVRPFAPAGPNQEATALNRWLNIQRETQGLCDNIEGLLVQEYEENAERKVMMIIFLFDRRIFKGFN